nr:hypothetical protein CTI12_AA390800 [Ipomoea batatas]
MDKNISIEVTEQNRAMASDTAKATNSLSWRKIGFPVSLLFPPGTVRIAANMIVVIRVATSMHDDAVSFIHFSPCFTKLLCCSVNSICGVCPLESFISLYDGCTIFSTSYKYEPKDVFLAVNDSNVENTLALLIHLPYQIRIRANELHNKLNVP